MRLFLASEFPEVFKKATPFFPKVKRPYVTVINTAAIGEGYELNYETEIKPFIDFGCEAEIFDINSQNEHIEGQFAKSDIIYFAGGNTFYLLECLQRYNVHDYLMKCFQKEDFLYVGSSAGSIITSPDISFIEPMDDKSKASLINTKGLEYISFFFLPHIGHPTMGNAAEVIKNKHSNDKHLLCLQDNQAIYLENDIISLI